MSPMLNMRLKHSTYWVKDKRRPYFGLTFPNNSGELQLPSHSNFVEKEFKKGIIIEIGNCCRKTELAIKFKSLLCRWNLIVVKFTLMSMWSSP